MNLVTIVIPMYNEQKNIEICVNVLKSQINQNFDVLFIDDGSSDNTLGKLKESLISDVEFNYKIIQQQNQGAAAARKKGIDYALTEFIMVFDCDDKLSNNLTEEIYTIHSMNNDVDIIIPEMQIQNKKNNWDKLCFYTQDSILKPLDCVRNSLNGWNIHGCFAIKKIIFDKSYKDYESYNVNYTNYINNDEIITRLNFLNSKIIIKSKATYYYCYNIFSTTKKINEKKYLMIKNALILNSIFLNNEIELSVKAELIAVSWDSFIYMKKHKLELKNILHWRQAINEGVNQLNYFKIIKRLSLKNKIQLTILKLVYLF